MLYAIVIACYTVFVTIIAYAKAQMDSCHFRLREKENKKDQMMVHIYGAFLIFLPIVIFSLWTWGFVFLAFKFTLVSLAIYFIVFELILNKLRGKPLLEVGTVWIFDVWVRKLASKTECEEEKLMVAIKGLILAICLFL